MFVRMFFVTYGEQLFTVDNIVVVLMPRELSSSRVHGSRGVEVIFR